jgi:VWFA-related protein
VADEYDQQAVAMLRSLNARETQRAARDSLYTIEGLVSGLTKMHGPKTIVYFSRGFGLTGLEGRLRTVVNDAIGAGARIYAIDARGLAQGGPADTLNSLSVDTGGLMIFNENNIGRALDLVAFDTGVYYLLGYQPLNPNYDRKFRTLTVHVKRSDVRVRARKGYLAIDPRNNRVPQPVK